MSAVQFDRAPCGPVTDLTAIVPQGDDVPPSCKVGNRDQWPLHVRHLHRHSARVALIHAKRDVLFAMILNLAGVSSCVLLALP